MSSDRGAAWERANDGDEDHRSDECDGDAAPEPGGPTTGDQRECESADERADQPDDDVTDDAVSPAFHDDAGQPAGDQSHDEPSNDAARIECHPFSPSSFDTFGHGDACSPAAVDDVDSGPRWPD